MKFQGEIGGQVEYDYHIPSGLYYEKEEDVPTFAIWEERVFEKESNSDNLEEEIEELPEQKPMILGKLKDAFKNEFQSVLDSEEEAPF
jgi:hypothetical protein